MEFAVASQKADNANTQTDIAIEININPDQDNSRRGYKHTWLGHKHITTTVSKSIVGADLSHRARAQPNARIKR